MASEACVLSKTAQGQNGIRSKSISVSFAVARNCIDRNAIVIRVG